MQILYVQKKSLGVCLCVCVYTTKKGEYNLCCSVAIFRIQSSGEAELEWLCVEYWTGQVALTGTNAVPPCSPVLLMHPWLSQGMPD